MDFLNKTPKALNIKKKKNRKIPLFAFKTE